MAKVVVLGDNKVGKTALLITYTSGVFPSDYLPSVFDNYSPRLGPPLPLAYWDTRVDPEYEKFLPLSCKDADFVLLCYSVADKLSFENVQSRWIEVIKAHCPNARVVLCATKIDLRDQHKDSITADSGKKLSKQIGAIEYLEVSALKNIDVRVPFDTMIHYIKDKSAQSTRPKKRECIIS